MAKQNGWRRVVAGLLAAVMVCGVMPMLGISVGAEVKTGDDGTTNWDFIVPVTHQKTVSSGYTAIRTANDLNNVRNNLSGKFILMNDIDLSGWGNWVPIGDSSNPFTGSFDGNGYVIYRLTIDINASGSMSLYAGLFSRISGGEIKNLGINNSNVRAYSSSSSYGAYAGSIAGFITAHSITNCFNTGDVTASSPSCRAFAGGIVGITDSSIKNCYNQGEINALSYYESRAGGIAGSASKQNATPSDTISVCSNSGKISASAYYSLYVGGILGYASLSINNCFNSGNVNASRTGYGSQAYVAGVVGYVSYIKESYNSGNVSITDYDRATQLYLGSIAAYVAQAQNTNSCFYLEGTAGKGIGNSANTTDSALSLTDTQMRQQISFVGFDFANVWIMPEGGGYPELRGLDFNFELPSTPLTASDIYPFNNSHNSFFGHNSGKHSEHQYFMSDSDFAKLANYTRQLYGGALAEKYISDMQTQRASAWGGSCYGMSVTTILNKQGKVNIPGNYDPGKTTMRDLRAPYANPALRSAINYYQNSWTISEKWAGTFYNKNENASAWSAGLRALTEEAKTNKPILLSYYFGNDLGHAIVVKGYQAAADGSHNLLAYDNRNPSIDTIVKVNTAFTSMTVAGSENAIKMYFTSDLSGYDNIDIDGPANNFVLAVPPTATKAGTDVAFTPNGAAITITNAEGQTLAYNGTTGTYSGTMQVLSQSFKANSTVDGDPTAATVLFEVPDSSKFTFQSASNGIDASVVSGSLYAAGSSSKATSVTIESGKGVTVSGSGSYDYTASLGVNNQLCDTVLLNGTATGSVSVQPKNSDVLVSGGTGATQLTVFSDTVNMQDITFTDPEGDILITKTNGNIDVRTSSQGNGNFDVSVLTSTKYVGLFGKYTKYESNFRNWFLFIVCFGWLWMWL